MADDEVSAATLAALKALETPSVCNAIELVVPDRRAWGFTTRTLHCVRPELGAMVGLARTVAVRAAQPPAEDAEAVRARRFAYLDYLAKAAGPTISVVECLDAGQEGFGSFWGEVNSAIHKALGCIGTVTNGSVRDIDALAAGFQVLAGAVGPSHGYVHVVDFAGTVSVAGMQVRSGDLVHADRHGAVTLPRGKADEVLEAAALIARREAVMLEAARAKGATIDSIKQAMIDAAKVG